MVSATLKRTSRISAGSYDLNKWLYGGYEKDIITMIAGPPGSGKTNFCILAAASQAKKGNKVLFIDTEGGFSVERMEQILEENNEDKDKILANIILAKPTSFEEQKQLFVKITDKITEGKVGLVIVDSMAMLYRLELGDAAQSGEDLKIKNVNREMAKQMRDLAEISRKKSIPVIITNQVYTRFSDRKKDDFEDEGNVRKEVNIVGGDLFKYWSKCIIELQSEGARRSAFLLKHRSLPQSNFNFEIKNRGIFKKGLF